MSTLNNSVNGRNRPRQTLWMYPFVLVPTYLDHSVRPVQSGDRGGLDGRQDGKVGIEVVVMFP